MAIKFVLVFVSLFVALSESRPYYRWFDYEQVAKPIHDTGSGHILLTVNPLRPYEPWVLDCNLMFHEKETGKRHPRCKEIDEENEKEYAKFLLHVQQWEEAYPDRAERWNTRFPEAKEKEKKKYEQLKLFSDAHKPIVENKEDPGFSTTSSSSQRAGCENNANCKNENVTTVKAREEPEMESSEELASPEGDEGVDSQ